MNRIILGVWAMMAWGAAAGNVTAHRFEIGESDFLLDGQPFVIRSGEMHAARIPREYWAHRLAMIRAMGCNTVCAYLFWNLHEPEPGQFNFSGIADVAEYCRLAQKAGLHVILRPGPYSCAEWDFGGFPYWLLKDPNMKLRTQYPPYLDACRRYLLEVGKQLAPLQVTRGGPIIMVQVENEYGSYGGDRVYVGKIRDMLLDAGFEVPLFTCDGPSQIFRDVRPDIFSVVNFGNNPAGGLAALRRARAKGPLMCGEFYPGWFDHWGEPTQTSKPGQPEDKPAVLADLRYMLKHRASFSIYMAHGGTSFGFWAGANGMPYRPQPSSYDYGAPISEAGWATPSYLAMRKLFVQHLNPGETIPDIPAPMPVITVPEIPLTESAPLTSRLPEPRRDVHPQSMEMYNQAHGCILYRAILPAGPAGTLDLGSPRDWTLVFLDGRRLATLDRRRDEHLVKIPAREKASTLEVMIEAMGRINYGEHLADRKGLVGKVTFQSGAGGAQELTNWLVYPLPLDAAMISSLPWGKTTEPARGPAFHRGVFRLTETGDTFLNMREWGKGLVWVNGHALGRYWSIGPTQTMYLPGCWLKKGANELVVLELDRAPAHTVVAGQIKPILGDLKPEPLTGAHRKPGQNLKLGNIPPTHSGALSDHAQWQTVLFAAPVRGRYFCLQALDSYPGDTYTSIAELELCGADGKDLSRAAWSVLYADSEELLQENGTADNVFDLQATTYWHTAWDKSPKHPHEIVLDLGATQTVSGFRILPRQDRSNGRIRRYRIWISNQPFPGL